MTLKINSLNITDYRFLLLLFVITISSCGPNIKKSERHLTAGIDKIFQARHQEALEELNLAIRYNPESSEAFYYRGACKRNLQDIEGAIEDYKKSIELNPAYADAYFNLGSIYDYLQDRSMACYYYIKAEALGRPNTNEYTRWCK
ncbi:MAG: hypothetical protein FD155_1646 [Bacteroidetes bacterium]|nr:MAG: hypothetical protein FD155_1646 [Bacteroidota bacterium]